MDIQIKTPKGKKPEGEKPEEKTEKDYDATDYIVEGASVGAEVLADVKKRTVAEEERVVYGVYNNSDMGLGVKINDFLIDHSKVSLKDKSCANLNSTPSKISIDPWAVARLFCSSFIRRWFCFLL